MGTSHLCLLVLRLECTVSDHVTSVLIQRWLSSASRSRRRSEKARPFRTSTGLRIAVGRLSHTLFAQRGSVCINVYSLRIAADWGNVNASCGFTRRSSISYRLWQTDAILASSARKALQYQHHPPQLKSFSWFTALDHPVSNSLWSAKDQKIIDNISKVISTKAGKLYRISDNLSQIIDKTCSTCYNLNL